MDVFSFSDFFFRYCLPPFLFFFLFTVSGGQGGQLTKTKWIILFFKSQFTKGRHIFVIKIPPPQPLLPVNCYQLWQRYYDREICWTNVMFDVITQGQLKITFPCFFPYDVSKAAALSLPGGLYSDHLRHKPKFPVSLENLLQSAGAGGWWEKGWREGSVRASSNAGEIPHRVLLFLWSYTGNKVVLFVQKQCAFKKPDSSELIQCPHTWQCKGQILIPFVLG